MVQRRIVCLAPNALGGSTWRIDEDHRSYVQSQSRGGGVLARTDVWLKTRLIITLVATFAIGVVAQLFVDPLT